MLRLRKEAPPALTTGIVGKERTRAVRLKQRADMRLAVEAHNTLMLTSLGFIWQAAVKAGPGIKITAGDKYATDMEGC